MSYVVTNVNIRAEEWQSVLFLSHLFSKNPVFAISISSLVSKGCAIAFSSLLGYALDYLPRSSILGFLALQKVLIAAITLLLWSMDFFAFSADPSSSRPFDGSFIAFVILKALLKIVWSAVHIGIEKDYANVIATDSTSLSKLNANLKMVDLTCKLAVPILISLLSKHYSLQVSMICISCFAFISIFIEFFCMVRVYRFHPKLAVKCRNFESTEVAPLISDVPSTPSGMVKQLDILTLLKMPVFLSSCAISVLYMNSLNFSGVLIAYLSARGIESSVIATIKGFCVMCGLGATITFPSLAKNFGLERLGLFALGLQAVALTFAVAPFYVDPSLGVNSMIFLFGGIAISRWALWSFDMAQTQILQSSVPNDLGMVMGVQISLQIFFELASYAITSVWSLPKDFYIPASASLGACFSAALIFGVYLRANKAGHSEQE